MLAVVRTPPDVSAFHRHRNPLFARVLDRLGRDDAVHAVVLPRTAEQRAAIRSLGLPSLHVPEHAVDAQSLVALADLVVSAGGTMNREAVALCVPVYTTFGAGWAPSTSGSSPSAGWSRSPTPTGWFCRTRSDGRFPNAS